MCCCMGEGALVVVCERRCPCCIGEGAPVVIPVVDLDGSLNAAKDSNHTLPWQLHC